MTALKRLDCEPVYLSVDQYVFLMQFTRDALKRRVMKALAYGVVYGSVTNPRSMKSLFDPKRSSGLIVLPVWVLPEISEEDYKS